MVAEEVLGVPSEVDAASQEGYAAATCANEQRLCALLEMGTALAGYFSPTVRDTGRFAV